jgi:hypothetical protein
MVKRIGENKVGENISPNLHTYCFTINQNNM